MARSPRDSNQRPEIRLQSDLVVTLSECNKFHLGGVKIRRATNSLAGGVQIWGAVCTVFELGFAVTDLAVAVPLDMDGDLVRDPVAALPA